MTQETYKNKYGILLYDTEVTQFLIYRRVINKFIRRCAYTPYKSYLAMVE